MDRDRTPLRCAVIGAGMAGILSAIKLTRGRAHRLHRLREGRPGRAGPGGRTPIRDSPATCPPICTPTPSPSPPSGAAASHPVPEIRAYFERVAEEHGVVPHVRFGDAVTRCTFSDGRWLGDHGLGHHDEVDVVIAATGVLHHPRYPDIDGIDTLRGSDLPQRPLGSPRCELDGARIGIIGTGSTAVQIVSAVVDRVAQLSLFQRTAQWVMPQENPAYPTEERRGVAGRSRRVSAAPTRSSRTCSICSPMRWWTSSRPRSR